METLPFDLKTFPHAAADLKVTASVTPRWQSLWFRASVIALGAILIWWIFWIGHGIGLVFPWLFIAWFINILVWQRFVLHSRQKLRQNAFAGREVYTVRLDDQAITLASPLYRRSFPRAALRDIHDWRGNLLVVVDALTYIAIPPAAFADAPSRTAFIGAVKTMIPAERPAL